MTEYEAYDLFNSMTSTTNQVMFGYFSLISGFLIVSYLIAEKLNYVLSSVVIVLFSGASLYIVLSMYAINSDLDALFFHMIENKEAGKYHLEWLGSNPAWLSSIISMIQIFITIGGYLGSLIFFIYRKRQARA